MIVMTTKQLESILADEAVINPFKSRITNSLEQKVHSNVRRRMNEFSVGVRLVREYILNHESFLNNGRPLVVDSIVNLRCFYQS